MAIHILCQTNSSNNLSSTRRMSIPVAIGNWMKPVSRLRISSIGGGRLSSSRRFPNQSSKKEPLSSSRKLGLGEATEVSTDKQKYEHTEIINAVRRQVDEWRKIPDPHQWQVTSVTASLLQYWRHHEFSDIRPFFCQIEAVETAIWLTEVATKKQRQHGRRFLEHLENVNNNANPGLSRLALKLATGRR